MTIAELIENLQRFPSDNLVVVAKDAEGNGSPLSEVARDLYAADSSYSGELVDAEDEVEGAVWALVLWPVN